MALEGEILIPGNYPKERALSLKVISSGIQPLPKKNEHLFQNRIIMATDIRRFTETVEKLESLGKIDGMRLFLSNFFDECAKEIYDCCNEAVLNKYLGDGFLAHFPVPGDDAPMNEMINAIEKPIDVAYKILNLFNYYIKKFRFHNLGLTTVLSLGKFSKVDIGTIYYIDHSSLLGKNVNSVFRALNVGKGNILIVFDDIVSFISQQYILVDLGKQAVDGIERLLQLYSVMREKMNGEILHEGSGKNEIDLLRKCMPECDDYPICIRAWEIGIKDAKAENEGRRQEVIADKLNKTQPEVSKLLKQAEGLGIIRKIVTINIPIEYQVSISLKEKFTHISKAIVINCRDEGYLKKELGKAAAEEIRSSLRSGDRVALSCGTTVSAALDELKNDSGNIKNLEIYPLVIPMNPMCEEISSAGLVTDCIRAFPGSKGYIVQLPIPRKNIVEVKRFYQENCEDILQGALQAEYMITGIGAITSKGEGLTHSFNSLINGLGLFKTIQTLGGVAESCHQPITSEGENLMEHPELELLRNSLLYVPISKLREFVMIKKTTILAVAGGRDKHEAILATLKAKVFNQLVTDIVTAEFLVG